MDLPVWVNGEQLWVKGVEKKTTCDDIIKVLLGQEYEDYSLFEKWKGVERRLRGVSKVWKIWKEWGDAQGEVRLTLKKEGRESPRKSRHPKQQRRRKQPQSIEVLLKLILIQGETIQNQLKKLKEKEEEIRQIEEAKHRERVNALGSNYLLDAYFEKESDSGMVTEYPSENSPQEEAKHGERVSGIGQSYLLDTYLEKGSDSGMVTEYPTEVTPESDTQLRSKLELWEKIVKLNRKIEKEEETLVKLFVALREYGEGEVIKELRRLRAESERFAKELEHNRTNLTVIETTLGERKRHLQTLHSELEESERETVKLLEILHSYASPEVCVLSPEDDRDCLLEAIV